MTGTQQTRPGRPAIGDPIKIRLGDDLQAAVDQWADSHGVARAAAIRQLITAGLAAPVDELARLFPEFAAEDRWERDYLIWDHIYSAGADDLRLQLGWVEGGGSGYDVAIELGAVYARGQWILFRTVIPHGGSIGDGDLFVAAHDDEEIFDAYRALLATTTDEYFEAERGPLWVPDHLDGTFGVTHGTSVTMSWEGIIDPATVEGMVDPAEEPAPWEI